VKGWERKLISVDWSKRVYHDSHDSHGNDGERSLEDGTFGAGEEKKEGR